MKVTGRSTMFTKTSSTIFDALQLGLTATPKDAVEHNTFSLFDCEDGIPTYAYSYEEAINNKPPYLCDFEVLKSAPSFKKKGLGKIIFLSPTNKNFWPMAKNRRD